jgi:hypothetical protein
MKNLFFVLFFLFTVGLYSQDTLQITRFSGIPTRIEVRMPTTVFKTAIVTSVRNQIAAQVNQGIVNIPKPSTDSFSYVYQFTYYKVGDNKLFPKESNVPATTIILPSKGEWVITLTEFKYLIVDKDNPNTWKYFGVKTLASGVVKN